MNEVGDVFWYHLKKTGRLPKFYRHLACFQRLFGDLGSLFRCFRTYTEKPDSPGTLAPRATVRVPRVDGARAASTSAIRPAKTGCETAVQVGTEMNVFYPCSSPFIFGKCLVLRKSYTY